MDEQNRKIESIVLRFDVDLNPPCVHCGQRRSEHFQPGLHTDPELAARWCPRIGGGFESRSFKAAVNQVSRQG